MAFKIILWISFIIIIYTVQSILCFNFESDENIQAIRNISLSINQFTYELHKVIANSTNDSFIASPISAAMILMMAAYGARGQNALEMNSVLHFDSNNTIYKTGINSLIQMLNAIKSSEVKLGNKIYAAEGIEIDPNYLKLIQTTFNSSVENVDFTNSNEAAKRINQWYAEQTHQRIEQIIDSNDINQRTSLVLINAVYFKALWSSPFETEDTRLQTFHLNELETKEVLMMHQSIATYYGVLTELDATFVRLNFKNDYEYEMMSMIIILPNKINGLQKIEKNIHKYQPSDFEGEIHQVNLMLPKFKIESEIHLEEELHKLGLITAFNDNADFSGICKKSSGLKIDKIIQKVVFEMNENGVEAEAVTLATLDFRFGKDENPEFKNVPFHVKRPYLSYVTKQNTILFTGKVSKI